MLNRFQRTLTPEAWIILSTKACFPEKAEEKANRAAPFISVAQH